MKTEGISRYLVALAFASVAIIMAYDIRGMQNLAPTFSDKMALQAWKIGVLFSGLVLAVIALIVLAASTRQDEEGLFSLSGRWLLGFLFLSTLVLGVARNLQAITIASMIGLALIILPRLFADLAQRVERLGPIVLRPPVNEALQHVRPESREQAEQQARAIDERLRASMKTWQRFVNALRGEIAALGVRITALEEEHAALRARIQG